MPRLQPIEWSLNKEEILKTAKNRVSTFCLLNKLEVPKIVVHTRQKWWFDSCAYYRPSKGINLCLDKCASPCSSSQYRNWSWPGNTVDREPFGVVCHELGHHVDWSCSEVKYRYSGNLSSTIRDKTNEDQISGYCDNDCEWFAEMFRLFVTNHALLALLRPKTYREFCDLWKPVSSDDWLFELGSNVPSRVILAIRNKIKKI